MPDQAVPIAQILKNYLTNLPVFPPTDEGPAVVHRFYLDFYRGFSAAAGRMPKDEQPGALERIQKALWTFARFGQLKEESGFPTLEISREVIERELKMSRAEEAFTLLAALGAQVELHAGGAWSAGGKLKSADSARLRFTGDDLHPPMPLARAFPELTQRILACSPKDKPAFERFLRADPGAVLAREKPPLAMPPDSPAILANLGAPAAAAWRELCGFLAAFANYTPWVEFRSIHHGMWVVNYNRRSGGIDLCGLVVQNSQMTARVILYTEMHERVGAMLEEFGDPVRGAFKAAHWYEDFQHQWLFIPVKGVADLPGVKRLLEMQAEALKKRMK